MVNFYNLPFSVDIKNVIVYANYNVCYISAFAIKITVVFPSIISTRFWFKCKLFTRVNTMVAI